MKFIRVGDLHSDQLCGAVIWRCRIVGASYSGNRRGGLTVLWAIVVTHHQHEDSVGLARPALLALAVACNSILPISLSVYPSVTKIEL